MSERELDAVKRMGWSVSYREGIYSFRLEDKDGLSMPEVLGEDANAFSRSNMQTSVDRWIAEELLSWSTDKTRMPGDTLTRLLTENASAFKDAFLETKSELGRVNYGNGMV